MGLIKTSGITVYYIDFALAKHQAMKLKTIAHNLRAWRKQLTIHERINFKTAYPIRNGKLFEELHLLNTEFAEQPFELRF